MSKQDTPFIATHVHPAWRNKSDYIFRCPLDQAENHEEWEQMWGEKNDDDSVTLCCIPFFAYGLSLGDVVNINSESVLIDIKIRSNNLTARVWTKNVKPKNKKYVIDQLLKFSDDAEIHSDSLIALSVDKIKSDSILNFFKKNAAKFGFLFEISNQ